MRSDKGDDRLSMALEAEAGCQFIGGQLEVGRFLQGNEIPQELDGLRWPVWPMVPTGESGTKLGALSQPAGAQSVKMCATDLEIVGSIRSIDLPFIELLEDSLKERIGEASGQLLFYDSESNQSASPWSRNFVSLRYAQASSIPRPRGSPSQRRHQSPFELAAVSFCSRSNT
jgi:hypothetical protein